MRKRYTISVLAAEPAAKPTKYTVEVDSDHDAILLAFALDGGFNRSVEEMDAAGMLALALEYCTVEAVSPCEATIERLRECVDRLFVNGWGQRGERLVITSAGGRDLGGWFKRAIVDRLAEALSKAPSPGNDAQNS